MVTLAQHRYHLQKPLSYGKADRCKGFKPRTLLTKQALLDQAATYTEIVENCEATGDGAQRILRAAYAMTIVARLLERDGIASTLELLEARQ